jgi:cell division protein ZapA (FtsZ GTPase activity inhibitor)
MKVQITIRGRTYTVRSDEDDVDLRSVAAYVDRRMDEVAQKATAGFDDYTVAMLACLNIASDFERYRLQIDGELADLDRELASGEVVLRAALPETDG